MYLAASASPSSRIPQTFRYLTWPVVVLIAAVGAIANSNAHAEDESSFAFSVPKRGLCVRESGEDTRILFNQGALLGPRLHPDGTRVLFNSQVGGAMGVWIAEVAEAQWENAPSSRVCDGEQAAWSRDATAVLFQRDGRILERDLESGEETDLTPPGAPALAYPTCLPNGDILCTDAELRCVYQLGRSSQRLTALVEAELHGPPQASHDGSRIAHQDGPHLRVLDLSDGGTQVLTTAPGIQMNPVWAADDGGLCYLHAPSPFTEEWDLYSLRLDTPQSAHRVRPRIHAAFDWNGAPPESTFPEAFRGAPVRVQIGERPIDEAPSLPLTARDRVTVENDWFALTASKEGRISLTATDDAEQPSLKLRIADMAGRHPNVASVTVVARGADHAALRVDCQDDHGAEVSALLCIRAETPAVEARFDAAGYRLELDAPMAWVVVPDRLSSDLVLTPGDIAKRTEAPLPQAPLVLTGLKGTSALALVVSADPLPAYVERGTRHDQMRGLRIDCAEAPVYIALLAGTPYWRTLSPQRADGAENWSVEWERPFPAIWRTTAWHGEVARSRQWGDAYLEERDGGLMPVEWPVPERPDILAYAWERERNTDLNITTPMDVVWSLLGIDGASEALDLPGLLTYRSAEHWVPFRELSTRHSGWTPSRAHQEPEGFGILEVMTGIKIRPTPGVHSFVKHLGDDACALLRGLDKRIREYEDALDRVNAFCGDQQDALSREAASVATAALKAARSTTLDDVAKADEALAALLTACDPQAREDQTAGTLAQFSDCTRALLEERQDVLAMLRESTQRIRNRAARAVVFEPATATTAEKLRAETHAVLRNRYYLEGDWRGEVPLAKGEGSCSFVWAP